MRGSLKILFGAALLVGATASEADAQNNPANNAAPAAANPAPVATTSPQAASPAPSTPSSLVLHFDPGSAAVRQQDLALLDEASHLYRAGNPIVMIVTGSADTTGSAGANLRLSQQRANNVLQGLVARGIPVERFQVMANGE